MKYLYPLTAIFMVTTAYAEICTDGNGYEMNMCLTKAMSAQQQTLEADPNISADELSNFISLRNKLCSQISARYAGGSFEAINYGHCILSLNDWYMEQMRP